MALQCKVDVIHIYFGLVYVFLGNTIWLNDTVAPQSTLTVEPLLAFPSYALIQAESVLYKIPGFHTITRYVKSSYPNDSGRTVLEVLWPSWPFAPFFSPAHVPTTVRRNFLKGSAC